MNIGKWFKDNLPTILTVLGGVGMVGTVILAVQATPKAEHDINIEKTQKANRKLREEGDDYRHPVGLPDHVLPKLTVVETVQACWQDYIPAAVMGAASLVCVFSANALNRKQQASLAGAYTALSGLYQSYRDKVRDILGPGTDDMLEKSVEEEKQDMEDNNPPWDEIQTFYLPCGGRPEFFERTMEEVKAAEYDINRNFILKGRVTLNEFLAFLGLEGVKDGDELGWDNFVGEAKYGYQWIDFWHRHYYTDDGLLVCSIETPFMPHRFDELDDDNGEDKVPTCGVD